MPSCVSNIFPVLFIFLEKATFFQRRSGPEVKRFCHRDFSLCIKMAIDVRSGFYITVAEPFLSILEREAHIQQIARGTMTQFMKTDVRQSRCFEQKAETSVKRNLEKTASHRSNEKRNCFGNMLSHKKPDLPPADSSCRAGVF